jgi:ferredoxin
LSRKLKRLRALPLRAHRGPKRFCVKFGPTRRSQRRPLRTSTSVLMPDKASTAARPALPDFPDSPAVVHQARLEPGGQHFDAPADLPLLLSAERAGLPVVSSCRNGTCRACICQLVSGCVMYRIEWPGLSAEEKLAGRILPCVAYPACDVILKNS